MEKKQGKNLAVICGHVVAYIYIYIFGTMVVVVVVLHSLEEGT